MDQVIGLGDLVRDRVTGFEGVVTGMTNFLHGCTRVGVQGRALHEGKVQDAQWFDLPQLEMVTPKVVPSGPLAARETAPGGPMPSVPTRNATPPRR